jgi:hypothetical protein
MQSVVHTEQISKKQESCPLNFKMFRELDLVGFPAEKRFNRKFFQCEHFLKCWRVIEGVDEENIVDMWVI